MSFTYLWDQIMWSCHCFLYFDVQPHPILQATASVPEDNAVAAVLCEKEWDAKGVHACGLNLRMQSNKWFEPRGCE